ncbi:MAG TPA: DUF4760 domain-containing protein [Rhizomicrobium sp.]|jgi:hypothetical protein
MTITLTTQWAAIIGALLATCGWLYTARRARALSKKQQTVNVMLQASFNADYQKAVLIVSELINNNAKIPDLRAAGMEEKRAAFRRVANHYEFMAAGLRNGDFDERLIRDSERGAAIQIFEKGEEYIRGLRNVRRRTTLYEHLEWLYDRWERRPPPWWQCCAEWCLARPFSGRRVKPG